MEQKIQKLDLGPLCFFLDLSISLSDKEGRVQQEGRKNRFSCFSRAYLYNITLLFLVFCVINPSIALKKTKTTKSKVNIKKSR